MCLYPCYIDGTKTVAEGRRIPKEKACVKQPWAKDIVEALKELMLSQAFEVHLLYFSNLGTTFKRKCVAF